MTDDALLVFPDAGSLADLRAYADRASRIVTATSLRLQAHGNILAAYVGIRAGTGLLGGGTILALRAMDLAEPSDADVTVPLTAVGALLDSGDATSIALPTRLIADPVTGVTPPRRGWTFTRFLPMAELAELGGASASAPSVVGTTLVHPTAARAALRLGFLSPEGKATMWSTGNWQRITTPAGHVVIR